MSSEIDKAKRIYCKGTRLGSNDKCSQCIAIIQNGEINTLGSMMLLDPLRLHCAVCGYSNRIPQTQKNKLQKST